MARGIGIRNIEARPLLEELKQHGLIDSTNQGIAVLGVSQVSLLHHTADIFEAQSPVGVDRAVIELAELSSRAPLRRSDCEEHISDTYRLSGDEIDDVFTQSEHIGFVDHEIDGEDILYFNGSLFRRSDAAKTRRLLENLNTDEAQRLAEAEALVKDNGCILADRLQAVLGQKLWMKLHQIGFFDVSEVVNERGTTGFATKPDALAKYVPNGLADILDDAKALASSLAYGIVKSDRARGMLKSVESSSARVCSSVGLIGKSQKHTWTSLRT
ncbi:MAG: hypothetical protein OXP28_12495 [Gammaproteobacteria bacterium]|nr:hypothetical protein [Gammaproteobacteria bacterium]